MYLFLYIVLSVCVLLNSYKKNVFCELICRKSYISFLSIFMALSRYEHARVEPYKQTTYSRHNQTFSFYKHSLAKHKNQANEISQEIEQRQRNKDEILWLTWLLASRGTNTLKVFLESLLTTDNLMVFHLLWRNSTKNSSYLFQKNTNEQLRIFKIVLNVALVNQSFAVCFLGFFLVLFWLLSTFFFYLLFSVFIAAKFVLSGTGLQTP